MLFKQVHLQGIKAGKISLAIRKWKKPGAKKGSLIKTAIGEVEIVDVEPLSSSQLTPAMARKAGFDTLEELKVILDGVKEGTLYKITLRYHGVDPRIKSREQSSLTAEEINELKNKLDRLDKFSSEGLWTKETLIVIRDNPMLRAADLARKTRREKDWLKLNIRKLKNLGLTISHETGYSLSPKGETFLKTLTK